MRALTAQSRAQELKFKLNRKPKPFHSNTFEGIARLFLRQAQQERSSRSRRRAGGSVTFDEHTSAFIAG
jgi:hypothetical protein